MDPVQNIADQREIARIILEGINSDSYDDAWLARMAEELATLVAALDVWRLNGGFDPYTVN